jgi:hypothetical protein
MKKHKEPELTDMYICKKMTSIVSSGSNRGIEVNLRFTTLKWIMKTKKCFFTGVKLNFIENDPNQLTIDRLDNDRGYVDDNIVACAKEFNEIKGCLTLKQIETLYKKLESKGLFPEKDED